MPAHTFWVTYCIGDTGIHSLRLRLEHPTSDRLRMMIRCITRCGESVISILGVVNLDLLPEGADPIADCGVGAGVVQCQRGANQAEQP